MSTIPSTIPESTGKLASARAFLCSTQHLTDWQQIASHLSFVDLQCMGGGMMAAAEWCRQNTSPDLLIVDVSDCDDILSKVDTLADVCEPHTKVVVVGRDADINLFRRLIGMGVSDYLHFPLDQNTVADALANVIGSTQGRERLGKTLAVVGCGGGVGTTSVVANLCWHLAYAEQVKTAACDYDIYTGDLDLLLGSEANSQFRLLLGDAGRLDDLLLDRALVDIDDRLALLKAVGPNNTEQDITIDPAALPMVNHLLQKRHNYVVWDLPPRAVFNAGGQQLLLGADTLVLVLSNTLTSVRQLHYCLQLAQQRPGMRVFTVLNHVQNDKFAHLKQAQIEQAINRPIDILLHHEPQRMIRAHESGKPMVADSVPDDWQEAMQRLLGKTVEKPSWLRQMSERLSSRR
ncbi:Septum site-determining protein MinD [BD1-7 clade bacterium]|uniref:Septum site-determining protein MinD n=1 Tax=BD1-7 clade bacterium TaxID=2029982 RepID=A0A5S9N625_9GAMM|nr:Septum site-determining protein MinD [BD1-7 clade bacterium]